jgi:DNA-binding PadR family transcriptional regulator
MSKVDLVLLGLLSEAPRHGYDIKQQIEHRHMEGWVGITMPAIYKGLTRLEGKNDLSARSESTATHPDRKVYSITEQGRETFQHLLHESLTELEHPYFRLLMGFGFSHLSEKQALLESLALRQERIKALKVEVKETKKEMRKRDCIPETATEIVQYYIDLIELERKWLKRVHAQIEGLDAWPEGVFKR